MRWIVGVLAVVTLVAGGVAVWLTRGTESRPAVVRGEPTTALYAPVDSRERDPEPLTVEEVFPADSVRASGITMVRASAEQLTDCAAAVWGDAPERALAGCSQVLRAGYAGGDGRVAGQFLLFNLPDAAAADALVDALRQEEGFVRRAPGLPEGFDGARGRAQIRALGHYVAVSWVGPVGGEEQADLTYPLLALDGLAGVVRQRILALA
jgi:hypothetical protein